MQLLSGGSRARTGDPVEPTRAFHPRQFSRLLPYQLGYTSVLYWYRPQKARLFHLTKALKSIHKSPVGESNPAIPVLQTGPKPHELRDVKAIKKGPPGCSKRPFQWNKFSIYLLHTSPLLRLTAANKNRDNMCRVFSCCKCKSNYKLLPNIFWKFPEIYFK